MRYASLLFPLTFFLGALGCDSCNSLASSNPPLSTAQKEEGVEVPHAVITPQAPKLAKTHKNHGALVFTSNLQGYVSPCGCSAEPLGGIARFSAAKKALDAQMGEVLPIIDAGNMFFEKTEPMLAADTCQSEARHQLLVSTFAKLGLEVSTEGVLDNQEKATWIPKLLSDSKIQRLTTNSEAHIIQRDGQPMLHIMMARFEEDNDHEKEIAQLRKRCSENYDRLDVVLAQGKRELYQPALDGLRGCIDIVVHGDLPPEGVLPSSQSAPGAPIFVSAGIQGQHLGALEFDLEGWSKEKPIQLDQGRFTRETKVKALESKHKTYREAIASKDPRSAIYQKKLLKLNAKLERLKSSKLESADAPYLKVHVLPLQRGMPEDRDRAQALKAYEEAIPELVKSCEESIECPTLEEGAPRYVGAQTCYGCHQAAFKFWQNAVVDVPGRTNDGKAITRQSGHSRAWDTLVREGKTKDRECIGCHSVGFNAPGGYCKTKDVGPFENVQCESCHGPGSNHVAGAGDPNLIRRNVPETTCRECHHPPHIDSASSFVYKERLEHILGPGHGEAFLKAQTR